MDTTKRCGETYRKLVKDAPPPGICQLCGGELDVDPEGSEAHCPVCEGPDE